MASKTFDLSALNHSIYLMEPTRLKLAVQQALLLPCPQVRDVAAFRTERLELARQAASRAVKTAKGKVGVIPIYGPIEQRMSGRLMKLGGTSTEEVGVALDALTADASVGAVVLHVDSPGGSSYGVMELSDKIYAARAQKPIHAISDSLAASAGIWLASAASSLSVTPSGDVGSVGVYALHVDESKALETEGIKVTAIQAGKFKLEGAPWEPLTAEAMAHFQEEINYTYGQFVGALARNRGVSKKRVEEDFGQGRLLNAEQALKVGLVDHIQTFEQLMSKLMGSGSEHLKVASMEVLRLRHEARKRRQPLEV
jgi:signal peptide peptidase SppA